MTTGARLELPGISVVATPPRSPFAGLDVCETVGLPLPNGVAGPRFEDDVWDFADVVGLAAYLRPVASRVDFTTIKNPRWRVVAKEYALALMAPNHPAVRDLPNAYRTPRGVPTCVGRHVELVRWLNWLTDRGVTSLGQVTADDCWRFVNERTEVRDDDGEVVAESKGARLNAVTAVVGLALYRDLFTDQHRYPPLLRPFDGKSPNQVAGMVRQSANSTPVVSDDVMQPLLAAALYVTSTLAAPLLRAYEQSVREERGDPLPCPRRPDHALLQRIIERHVADNEPFEQLPDAMIINRIKRGLMAENDPLLAVSLRTIAREAGYDFFRHRWLKQHRTALEAGVARVGLVFPWGRDAEPVARADDAGEVPWTAPSARRHATDLGGLLLTACMIVVAAISGMRRSELVELEPGCCLPVEETFEGMPRYKLAGKLIKGQALGGVRDQWVVTKDVYTAVQVAERLAALRGGALFPNVVFHVRYRTFREWVTGPAGQRLGLAPIPDAPVNLRMLRRTLAVALAYRPGGLLAAKVQLKHVSVAVTEGYASRPGGAQARFLADVAAEEQTRNIELLRREYEQHRIGTAPAGPGARGLTDFFRAVDSIRRPDGQTPPNVIDNDQQIRAMLARRAKTLHLGAANHCWFSDPAQALCLKAAGTPNADSPLLGMCDSTRCAQSTFHQVHREVWQNAVGEHERFLADLPRSQRVERARLTSELVRAKQTLAAIDAARSSDGA